MDVEVEIAETPTGAALVPAETPDPAVSIADHASQFSPEAQKDAAEAETKDAADLKPVRPVDQQRRTDAGQFTEGTRRIKAKDAVDRINQLTGRAKSAEEKLAAAEAELGRLRTRQAPAAQIATAERKVEQAEATVELVPAPKTDPEPQENDPKFGGDYGKYLADHARWAARDEYRQIKAGEAHEANQARVRESQRQTLRSWGARVTAAKQKYSDFEAVAFAQTRIQSGSPVDAFIMEDDAGAEVLYHLQQHPDELDSLVRMPVLGQLKTLSLLSQRLLPSSPTAAGTTRSAPERTVVLPPKPPNLVRTEAQSVGDRPPPTDGSLSIAEHGRTFGPKRR